VWWRFRWVGFPFSLRLEQGQCNDPDCPPPDHHHQFWPCRFSRPTWASLHWPFRCVRVRVGGQIKRRLPAFHLCSPLLLPPWEVACWSARDGEPTRSPDRAIPLSGVSRWE